MPSFAEPHAHLDKALTASRAPNPAGDLLGAIEAMQGIAGTLTREDIVTRADKAIRIHLALGTTSIRTHVNVGGPMGMRALTALIEVRERWRGLVDVQLVALVSNPMAGQAGQDLRQALREGADVAGGCPHLDPDPDGAVGICLDAAGEAGVPMDLHTDETLNPRKLTLATMADLVTRTGFPHQVTASHCVSLGVQDGRTQQRVAEAVAAARIAVVALPQTNLYLQGRDHPAATPRGLTAVAPLRAGGCHGRGGRRQPARPVPPGRPRRRARSRRAHGDLRSPRPGGRARVGDRGAARRARAAAGADRARLPRRPGRDARRRRARGARRGQRAPHRLAGGPGRGPHHRPRRDLLPPSSRAQSTGRSRPMTTATRAPALRFSGVTKRFSGGTTALADANLEVAPGEFVSVVGPSGCGKSTLLRIASGLDDVTGGSVEVGTKRLGYVFQDATLLPWRSVQQNVGLFAELEKMGKAERDRRIAEAIELVGLTGFEKHLPHQLSGGMRMRASLARSLVLDPEVFLFDEPFGALDEITRERLNDELLRMFELRSFAALFITHSVAEAVFLSTRVVVMSARPGRVIADIPVPFEYPRVPELRYTPEFAGLCGEVSRHLRGV